MKKKPSEIDLYETTFTPSEDWLDEGSSTSLKLKFGNKRQKDEDLDDEDDSFDADDDGPLDLVDGLKGDAGFEADFDEDNLETFDIEDSSGYYSSTKSSKYNEDDEDSLEEDNYDEDEDEDEDEYEDDEDDDDYRRSIAFDEDEEEEEEDDVDFDVDDDEFVSEYTRKGRRGSGGDDW